MSPPNTANRKQVQQQRHSLVDRCSTIRACEPCRGRKRICNGEAPGCIYNMISDHARSVFTTSTARRLSSGSACETCRRRKTKCDAGQPCSYCAANNLKCVNNAERRKRSSMSVVSTSLSSPSSTSTSPSSAMNLPASFSSPSSNTFLGNTNSDHEAMDRIEDRLRRIEQLMTVFTPSPLSQSTLYPDDVYRTCRTKDNSNNISPHFVRQQRHSVQGITVAKEQLELQIARRVR
ncbi:uncharacterized protein BX664DRAFT_173909 [Halteromyces radiatus]|uniref:uncharacterized protein n=1 Tax=Halteromyces radiatus TaxID=101107 RepID=UPI002220AE90|nr:uncharacterized protein BX664DRAFT_173909 [Halteromyces radiatus]KAI8084856.1 hypothetical protein BX664DRAFT_173909 [Halteromyces radiatus]